MHIEKSLALVREGFAGGPHTTWEDYSEFRADMECEYGIIPLEIWRNDEGRCWECPDGPVLADVVEYVELDDISEADPDKIRALCLGLVHNPTPVHHVKVPVYCDGHLVCTLDLSTPARRYMELSL